MEVTRKVLIPLCILDAEYIYYARTKRSGESTRISLNTREIERNNEEKITVVKHILTRSGRWGFDLFAQASALISGLLISVGRPFLPKAASKGHFLLRSSLLLWGEVGSPPRQ